MATDDADLRRFWPSVVAEHPGLRHRLLAAYDEPHRGYHNRTHLAEVFSRIEEILPTTEAADLDAVLLAAWFHDAVYRPEADNEKRSAELAEQSLTDVVPGDLVAEVCRLVRVTADHRVAVDDVNGAVLCDADLGILAADDDRYREYVDGVREEYAHVSDVDFRTGRALILRALAEAPVLFRTAYGREHWEARARSNVARELG